MDMGSKWGRGIARGRETESEQARWEGRGRRRRRGEGVKKGRGGESSPYDSCLLITSESKIFLSIVP